MERCHAVGDAQHQNDFSLFSLREREREKEKREEERNPHSIKK